MKKLILSLNPDMYNKYAGLQPHFDLLALSVAIFNFKSDMVSSALPNIASSSDLLQIDKKDDDNYVIIHKNHKVTLGVITRIDHEIAGTVANETGKTPLQLADDNKVLLEALKVAKRFMSIYSPNVIGDGSQNGRDLECVLSAIKQVTE